MRCVRRAVASATFHDGFFGDAARVLWQVVQIKHVYESVCGGMCVLVGVTRVVK